MQNVNNAKKILVVVQFKIPYALFWEDDLLVNMYNYFARIIIKRSFIVNNDRLETPNGGMQVINDRGGKLCKTNIICLLELHNESEESSFYLERAIKSVNRLLEVYRNMNIEEFYVKGVIERDLEDYKIYYILDNGAILVTENKSINVKLAAVSVKCPNEIREILYEGSRYPLWISALKNAQNHYDLGSYSQAIIEANICLENFVYTHIYERLKDKKTLEEINDFLSAKSPCSGCNDREGNIKLETVYPSIRKVIKYMYNEVKIDGLSNTKLNMLVDDINKYRNEIVHGRSQENVNRENARLAVKGIEKLISLSMKVISEGIILNNYNFSDQEAELLDNSARELGTIDIEWLKSYIRI